MLEAVNIFYDNIHISAQGPPNDTMYIYIHIYEDKLLAGNTCRILYNLYKYIYILIVIYILYISFHKKLWNLGPEGSLPQYFLPGRGQAILGEIL